MIRVFVDSGDSSAHDRFQAWRTNHQDGVFLTLKTQTRANLHGARCLHLGTGPPYFSSKAGFGSLTSDKKVCAPQSELLVWANKQGVAVKRCEHCERDGFLDPPDDSANYWIIKAKPERNDFNKLPIKGRSARWYTAKPPKTWRKDDNLFIWAGSPILRVIGCARLTKPDAGFDHNFHYFGVEYATNRIEGPMIEDLRRDPIVGTASFLKSGPSGTVFPLTRDQGLRMLQLVASLRRSLKSETPEEASEIRRRIGAGFGTAESNRKVERAAIAAAKTHYKNRGWQVKSVEPDKCGYDLRCRKKTEECHVEVKGISGVGFGFILTHGEFRKAESDNRWELCLVQSAMSSPTIKIFAGGEIFQAFEFVPLAFKALLTSD